ncbi:RNA-directed DNA polymerase, eukaryota [Tanacetum coccineum]
MGDFNEVRTSEERWGSCFNVQGAASFNSFISNVGLLDIQLERYSFTWAYPSATKMSKLDRFLMTNGFLSAFPYISTLCLDRHLSDHRPILLKEIISDYGPTPFRFYHSWLELPGFDDMISKKQQVGQSIDLKAKLCDIDKELDQGGVSDDILLSRMEIMKTVYRYINLLSQRDLNSKAKIVGDRRIGSLTPSLVKQEFICHFAERFLDPGLCRGNLDFLFPIRLNDEQVLEMEAPVSNDEIRTAVWGCGVDKSPGPDGFTFDFFRRASILVNGCPTTEFQFIVAYFKGLNIDSTLIVVTIILMADDAWIVMVFVILNGDGVFRFKDARNLIDEFLSSKGISLIYGLRVFRLRGNGKLHTLFFGALRQGCDEVKLSKVGLDYQLVESYEEWFAWFKSIRLEAKSKDVLEEFSLVFNPNSWLMVSATDAHCLELDPWQRYPGAVSLVP